jgi:prepilin-type N-terminal cleavage/methylation domain-containing protein
MRTEDGLTLIETLIAMVVFSIGTFAILSMQMNARTLNTNAINMTQAINLANHKIEEIMSLNYDDDRIKDDNGDIGIYTIYSEENVHNRYELQWKVDANFPMNNAKTIIVEVSWSNREGQRQISFEFIKAKI